MQRLRFLIWKEFLEVRKNPRLLGIVIVAPILQLTILGYAATTDVKDVPVVVADGDRSAASRELVATFDASPNFTVVAVVTSVREIDAYLERGLVSMALAIPSGYGARVAGGRPVSVQVVADGSDANSTTVALGYATALVADYASTLGAARAGAGAAGLASGSGVDLRIRVWFNPELESRDFMIPGVLALLLLVITAILSSMAIVRERELGTLEQLNVTPIRPWELIAGKLLPFALIGLVDVCLVLSVAIFWFEVPFRGSLLLLFVATFVYLTCTLGLGLFVSTISETQQQAMLTTAFFFLLPMMLLSGFIFPIENMPRVIQPVTYLIPLRYYLVMVRGIFLKGVGVEVLWPQGVAMLAWGLTALTLAGLRSRKQVG